MVFFSIVFHPALIYGTFGFSFIKKTFYNSMIKRQKMMLCILSFSEWGFSFSSVVKSTELIFKILVYFVKKVKKKNSSLLKVSQKHIMYFIQ